MSIGSGILAKGQFQLQWVGAKGVVVACLLCCAAVYKLVEECRHERENIRICHRRGVIVHLK